MNCKNVNFPFISFKEDNSFWSFASNVSHFLSTNKMKIASITQRWDINSANTFTHTTFLFFINTNSLSRFLFLSLCFFFRLTEGMRVKLPSCVNNVFIDRIVCKVVEPEKAKKEFLELNWKYSNFETFTVKGWELLKLN